MPEVLVGPMLRFIGESDATVWVETDAPCEVEVLGAKSPTFTVAGHHYALVAIEGLEPGAAHPVRGPARRRMRLAAGGIRHAPIRASDRSPPTADLRLLFGSCRFGAAGRPSFQRWWHPRSRHRRSAHLRAAHAAPADRALARRWSCSATSSTPTSRRRPRASIARPRTSTRRAAASSSRTSRSTRSALPRIWTDPDVRWLLSTCRRR